MAGFMNTLLKFDYILSFGIYEHIEPGKSSEVDGARFAHRLLRNRIGNTSLPETLSEALNIVSSEMSIILGCDFKNLSDSGFSKHEEIREICSDQIRRLLRDEFISKLTLKFQAFNLIDWHSFEEAYEKVFDKFLVREGDDYAVINEPLEDAEYRIILGGFSKEIEIQPLSYRVMIGDYSVTIDAASIDENGHIAAYFIKNSSSEVLTKNLEWVDYLRPSSRDEQYTSLCYYSSPESAKETILQLILSKDVDSDALISRHIKLPK